VTSISHMPDTSHIHIRPLEIGDFTFVRELASRQRNFTIPPVYVLWLIVRIKGAACLVAEDGERGQAGYLLAVPIEGPEESLFVWQLAALPGGEQEKATLALLVALREFASDKHIRTIAFSMEPSSAAYRLISRYTNRLVASSPRLTSVLPPIIAAGESEYRVDLG
jgi:hypothetical protein